MDRVGHIKNGNRSRSQSSREVRNKTQCNTIEMAALILGNNLQSDRFFINFIAAGDFDESNLSTIGSANKRGNSKALLSVGNKVLSGDLRTVDQLNDIFSLNFFIR